MGVSLTGAIFAVVALAASHSGVEPEMSGGDDLVSPADERIVGGLDITAADPSAVVASLDDRCSGVLVHPRVVAYAGHCGSQFTSVTFSTPSGAVRHIRVER